MNNVDIYYLIGLSVSWIKVCSEIVSVANVILLLSLIAVKDLHKVFKVLRSLLISHIYYLLVMKVNSFVF